MRVEVLLAANMRHGKPFHQLESGMTPITRAALKKLAGDVYFKRGVDYYNAGTVVQLRANRDGITARVQGSDPMPYLVRFWHEKQKLQWGCVCPPSDEGAFCKHLVTTGLAYLAEAR